LRVQQLDRFGIHERVRAQCAAIVPQVSSLGPERWLFSGGTSRAFGRVAIALGCMKNGQITCDQVVHLAERIQGLDAMELACLGVPTNRLDLFPQAASLLAELVSCFSVPAIGISTGGLRQGLVLREYERQSFVGFAAKNPQANRDSRR
jgi:exopolyphosphatase/pppGpp-phosphohydrolase